MTDQKADQEEKLDDTIDDSFPASDPPSHSGVTGAGHQDGPQEPEEERPAGDRDAKGHPTSERQDTETAYADETNRPQKDGHEDKT